jgi:hypothetical protein
MQMVKLSKTIASIEISQGTKFKVTINDKNEVVPLHDFSKEAFYF